MVNRLKGGEFSSDFQSLHGKFVMNICKTYDNSRLNWEIMGDSVFYFRQPVVVFETSFIIIMRRVCTND